MKRIVIAVGVLALMVVACNSGKNNSAWPTGPLKTMANVTPSTNTDKGVGPVDHVDVASLDPSKKEAGAKLFTEKCSACHKLGERYIGPALAGVTQRRQPEWILNMILNPENMILQDPTAKALFATFLTPMANQHLTREEAECVLVYFREHDKEASAAPADTPAAQGTSSNVQAVSGTSH